MIDVLVCYERPTSTGLLSGHGIVKVSAFTAEAMNLLVTELEKALETKFPDVIFTGRLQCRSVTKLDGA